MTTNDHAGSLPASGQVPGVLTRLRPDRIVARVAGRLRSGPWSVDALALTAIVMALVVLGLVMSFSASIVDAAEVGDPFIVFKRQASWAAIGVPAYLLVAATHHRVWQRLSWGIIAVALIGLFLVLVPGIGVTRQGATRWIGLGPVLFQPSELAKLGSLLWLADVLRRKRPRDGEPFELRHLLLPAMPLLAVEALLVMFEPDLGTTVLLAMIVGLVLFVEGLPLRWYAAGVAMVGALGALAAIQAPYRLARLTGWLDPEADPLGSGFQLLQSLYALGSGGVFGLGLGAGRGKWNYVPNPETDFVFAVIGEELGLVGAGVVLLLFGALLWVGMRIARGAPSPYARTVAWVITAWIVGQGLLNIATVTGLLPITGVTLPMVSVGGSSLVSTLVGLGILAAIARPTASEVVALPGVDARP